MGTVGAASHINLYLSMIVLWKIPFQRQITVDVQQKTDRLKELKKEVTAVFKWIKCTKWINDLYILYVIYMYSIKIKQLLTLITFPKGLHRFCISLCSYFPGFCYLVLNTKSVTRQSLPSFRGCLVTDA